MSNEVANAADDPMIQVNRSKKRTVEGHDRTKIEQILDKAAASDTLGRSVQRNAHC